MNSKPLKQDTSTDISLLSTNDEMGMSISRAIDNLSTDTGVFTQWRLRGTRGREAVKLAESSLVESMAAKRRSFAYQVGLVEDHAKKVMLSESMKSTAVIEREIAGTITSAVSNFENLVVNQEQAAYLSEIKQIKEAHSMLDSGLISERRCEQLIAGIEGSTDKIVETVQRTTREILANLEDRFNAALSQAHKEVNR